MGPNRSVISNEEHFVKETNMQLQIVLNKFGYPDVVPQNEHEPQALLHYFFEADIGKSLLNCEEVITAVEQILAGQDPQWEWNGNLFIVTVKTDSSTLEDKHPEMLPCPGTWALPTREFLDILRQYRQFLLSLEPA
jgi:hypothetical protein